MRLLKVTPTLSDEQAEALAGKLLDESAVKYLVRSDTEVRDERGELLMLFRKNVLPPDVCRAAYPALREAAAKSFNRGTAASDLRGEGVFENIDAWYREAGGKITGTRVYPFKKDGTVSNTNYAMPVNSGIVGFFDRQARFPYCRQTVYSLSHPERFLAAVPFIKAVDAVFAANVPDRYQAQRELVDRTSQDFVIRGTSFTTVTVNKNWQTAVHQDKGDLKAGFGVMSVLEHGKYRGGYLVFPRYGVAVDMRERDVCLADVHQWHGNTPIKGNPGAYERISCVFYYRENMQYCGTAEQELEFAKNRPAGTQIQKARPGKAQE